MTYDINTLEGARHGIMQQKHRRLTPSGPVEPGTEVICLRRSEHYGHYEPCYARIHHVTASGRIAVDLWADGSERAVVSPAAILWREEETA